MRLLRWTGATFGSLGSLLRGFLVFFSGSGTARSFAFGLGPGFLRGWPLAVKPRACVAGDAFAGVGVLVPTPTLPAAARTVDVGVPCSGECGGELRLPGDDASPTSMAQDAKRMQGTKRDEGGKRGRKTREREGESERKRWKGRKEKERERQKKNKTGSLSL